MKPHTKEVLDACTDVLVQANLVHRRRAFATWQINAEMTGAIKLQHQDFGDGSVIIQTCPQVYWLPVQKIYAIGTGQKYRAYQHITRSRIWSFINLGAPDLRFVPGRPAAPELARLRALVHDEVIPKVLELADERSISAFYRDEMPFGGHRPEMYLAIRAWLSRSVALNDEFDQVVSALSHPEFIASVTAFYARLRNAPDMPALLAG